MRRRSFIGVAAGAVLGIPIINACSSSGGGGGHCDDVGRSGAPGWPTPAHADGSDA